MSQVKQALFLFLTLLFHVGFAQDDHCGTDKQIQHALQTDPAAKARLLQTRAEVKNYLQNASRSSSDTIITIPVVVHVIHSGQAVDSGQNISAKQIQSQIDELNICFNKHDPDSVAGHRQFWSRIANVGINFCLAMFDTGGHATSGITRDSFPAMSQNQFDNNVKPATQWDPTKYMNIWVTQISSNGNILGYTNLPNLGPANQDGITVDYRFFGKTPANPFDTLPGTNTLNRFNRGKTAVHETGHWLGLYHTFGQTDPDGNYTDGCFGTTPETCDTAGDYICDTPPQSEATTGTGSNLVQNSCTETPVDDSDMWEDYMDYVDDNELSMFTNGQSDVMRAVLNTVRQSIQFSTAADSCKLKIFDPVNNLNIPDFNLSVYPNPSTGLINVDYTINEKAQLIISNALGQTLISTEIAPITAGKVNFQLNALPDGLYFIKMQSQHSEKTLKFNLVR